MKKLEISLKKLEISLKNWKKTRIFGIKADNLPQKQPGFNPVLGQCLKLWLKFEIERRSWNRKFQFKAKF